MLTGREGLFEGRVPTADGNDSRGAEKLLRLLRIMIIILIGSGIRVFSPPASLLDT